MMKSSLCALAVGFATVANAAPVAGVGGHADVFFIPSAKLDISVPGIGGGDDDGDGFGVQIRAPFSDNFAFGAEYRSTSYDDTGLDFDQLRAGVLTGDAVALRLEYVNAELEGGDADGLGVHGVFRGPVSENVELFGTIGYLMLEDEDNEDIDGLELSIGLSLSVSPNLGLLIGYRKTALEADSAAGGSADLDFDDLKIGLRAYF